MIRPLAAYRRRRLQRRMALPRLLEAFAAAHPRATFIEIGSNDGAQHDHLRPHILAQPWTGVMVEPVPYVFARLKDNYGNLERVSLENAAIAPRDGRLRFYHLRDADEAERAALPDWYDGVGSFNLDVLLSHAPQMPDIADRVVEVDVDALSFATLCARHGMQRPDLVLIDAEGHDWEIVRSIDLDRNGPRLLIYEHFHLSADDRAAARSRLEAGGYEMMEEGFDTVALLPAADRLTTRFRRLRPAVRGVAKYEEAS